MNRNNYVLMSVVLVTFEFCIGTTMHNSESPKNSSAWLTHAKQATAEVQQGQLLTHDATGAPITLQWSIYDPKTPRFTQAIKDVSEILVQNYVRQEVEFARKNPQTAANEMFFKPLAKLFESGPDNINWQAVQEQLTVNLRNFFMTTDFGIYAGPQDLYFFITAYDTQTGATLGLIQYLISPDFEYGTVRVCYFGVAPTAHHRGLEKLLMSSIFKILPTTTRMFLHTRATNTQVIDMYQKWGFAPFAGVSVDWPDFEYLADKSDALQATALLMN